MIDKLDGINYRYLLFEYYQELGIDNDEFIVLLMVIHLIESGNKNITNELLEVKLDMSSSEIDRNFESLITKKLIVFETENDEFVTSIRPLKQLLLEEYLKRIDIENDGSSQRKEILKSLTGLFESYFKRELQKVEVEQIEKWLDSGIPNEVIKDSLLDAFHRESLSFKKIDSIIASKMRHND